MNKEHLKKLKQWRNFSPRVSIARAKFTVHAFGRTAFTELGAYCSVSRSYMKELKNSLVVLPLRFLSDFLTTYN